MPTIVDVILNGASLAQVALNAALDVGVVCALLAATVLVSRLLETCAVHLIALVAGSGSAWLIEGTLTYPGVVYHELSHALFAVVSGARVTSISLRKRTASDGGTVLGSVQFVPRGPRLVQSLQLLLTGIAPAITGLAGMAAVAALAFPRCSEPWHWAIWIYLFACLLLHSGLSRQDLKGVGRGAPLVVAALFVVFLLAPFDASPFAQGAGAVAESLGSLVAAAGR